MSATEKVTIEFGLEVTTWKPDQGLLVRITINDTEYFSRRLTAGITPVRFKTELVEDNEYTMQIHVSGKEDADCQFKVVDGVDCITDDLLLHINACVLDDIPIPIDVVHKQAKFYSEKSPLEPFNTVTTGVHGYWEIKFTSPVYLWAFETI